MFDVNKPVTNPALKAKYARLRAENTNETYEAVLEEIALRAHFLLPVSFSRAPVPNGNGTSTFQKGSTMRVPALESGDGAHYFPLYSDWEELRRGIKEPDPQTLVVAFDDFAHMALAAKDIAGVAIDPFGMNLVLDRDLLEHMRQHKEILQKGCTEERITKETTVQLGEPKNYPTVMVEAVKLYLQTEPRILRAWLRLMVRDGRQSWLVVLETAEEDRKLFDAVAAAARPYLGEMFLDMAPLKEDGFGRQAIEGAEPFYVRDGSTEQ